MSVVGLSDGVFEVPDEIATQVAAERVSTPWAHPNYRPLLSGEVELKFGVTPTPVTGDDIGEVL